MPITQILMTAGSFNGPRVSWSNIDYSNVDEGQQNIVYLDFRNWDDSTVYWWLVDAGNNQISNGQLSSATSGTFSPGFGDYTNYESFNFTFAEDATTDGELTYYIRIENADGQLLMPRRGPFTVNDTSTAPTVIMSLIAADYAGSGTTWADSSGSNNPGTLVNSPTYQGANIPKYFTFDRASTEFVQGPVIEDLSTWTIESWFRISEPLSNTAATAIITTTFSDPVGGAPGVINYVLGNWIEGDQDGFNEELTVGFYAGQWYTTGGFVPDVDTWYHVVGTYDGDTIKQWVNGVLDSDRTITATTTAGNGPVRIGRRWDSAANDNQNFFPGDIAVAKIYNGVLTDQEIVAAWDATKATYPNYILNYGGANNVNEGSAQTFNVTGSTRITNGTYYWTVETNSEDFATISGSFTITNNTGSFTVTPTADDSTEGPETFTVALRSGSITGPILAISDTVDINDTSLTPEPPFSLRFNSAQSDFLTVSDSSAWAAELDWTIEFWSKAAGRSGGAPLTVMSQYDNNNNMIDIFYQNGSLCINNDRGAITSEPPVGGVPDIVTAITDSSGSWEANYGSDIATTGGTGTGLTVDVSAAGSGYAGTVAINTPGSGYTTGDVITAVNGSVNGGSSVTFTIAASALGVWTHVALVCNGGGNDLNVFYNGVNVYNGGGYYLGSNEIIAIGRRGPTNDFQYFNGNLAMIRISNTAKYLTAFNPSVTYGVEADTKLFLSSDTPLVDSKGNTVATYGVTRSDDFPIGSMTAFVSSWNIGSGTLQPSVAGNPDLTPVVAGWTVIGPLDFTATVVGSPFSNGTNWVIPVDASLAEFDSETNPGNYTFTPPA